MTYSQFGLIQAPDFNTFVGGNPTTSANTLNAVWATGGGITGYGQTAIANVAVGNTVTNTEWAALVNTLSNIAAHQGTLLTPIVAPVAGNTITTLNSLSVNLQAITTGRANAAIQGSSVPSTTTLSTTWINFAEFTHTVTFANANAARYFFNSGGQIVVQPSHPTGSGINQLISNLAADCGSIVISSPSSGNIRIGTGSGTQTYNGVTKIGGGAPSKATILPNTGYYGMSTSNITIFTQLANSGAPIDYLNSFISVKTRTNGTQGSNGDNGSVLTIYTTFDEVPGDGSGLIVSAGTAVTLTVKYPETTYISNTWGAVVVSGTVSAT